MASTRQLSFAGVDLIKDSIGHWRVLEVNDHPTGLVRADAIASADELSAFSAGGVHDLATVLASHKSVGGVALLLPECFHIEDGPSERSYIATESDRWNIDSRVESLIAEFNEIAKAMDDLHCSWVICGALDYVATNHYLEVCGFGPVASVYRRASIPPHVSLPGIIVNEMAARAVCADKLATFDILSRHLGNAGPPTTIPLSDQEQIEKAIQCWSETQRDVIWKPRYGAGSRGVERLTIPATKERLHAMNCAEDMLLQPWEDLATIETEFGLYRFDLRIFVIGGKACAGFARRAARRSEGADTDLPLSWLTTCGPQLSVRRTGGKLTSKAENNGELVLHDDELSYVFSLAEDAVSLLDAEARKQQMTAPFSSSFASYYGITNKIDPVYIRTSPSNA